MIFSLVILLFLQFSVPTEAKGKCVKPRGKPNEKKCIYGEEYKCMKGKWKNLGKTCEVPHVLVEKASSCLRNNWQCVSQTNLLQNVSSTDSLSCDQQCGDYGSTCAWWTFDKRTDTCSLLTDCNNGNRRNGIISGSSGCIGSNHFQISQGEKEVLVKDCFWYNTTCILPNEVNVIESKYDVEDAHSCGKFCAKVGDCYDWTYETDSGVCTLVDDCPSPTPATGVISGEKDCAEFRENHNMKGFCFGLFCGLGLLGIGG